MNFHVIADSEGTILAWIKAPAEPQAEPGVLLLPGDPSHILHEYLEIGDEFEDPAAIADALQQALRDRIDPCS